MIRKLATITTTAFAAIALASCSTSTPSALSASHPAALARSAAAARAARLAALAKPATCDHTYIPRWGVATCDAWDRLDAKQRAVFSGPGRGGVIQSVSFPTPTTVTVNICARAVATATGVTKAWPGTEWVALRTAGSWSGHTWVPDQPQIAGFSCAGI